MKKILRDCPEGNGLLSKMQRENMSEKDIQRIVADLILAASDTVSYYEGFTNGINNEVLKFDSCADTSLPL